MPLNGSPTTHCLLHPIKKVGSGTAEAAVDTRAAAANGAKWSEWEGGSEREEREKVSYELMLLLMLLRKIIIIIMIRQRVGFLSLRSHEFKELTLILELENKIRFKFFL